MHFMIAVLLALPQGGKIEIPWNEIYKGITPKSGTDAYGYVYRSNQDGDPLNFDWIEISSTGTNLDLSDDNSVTVTLPFVFKLYDDTTSTIHVQSNGGITFRDIKLSYSNHALPDANGTMIAVYWSDQNPYSHGGVYYQAFSDTMAVVEWYQVPEYSGTTYNTYEVILYSDGRVKLQYLDINDYSDETVGIQSKDAFSSGNGWYIQYVYNSNPNNHIPAESSVIEFYPPVPQDHDVGILSLTTPSVAYPSDTVSITASVKNYGLNQETFDVRFIVDTNSILIFDTTVTSISLDTAQITDVSVYYTVQSSGKYNVMAYTILPSDTNYLNDTAYTSFEAIACIPLPYITDFESDSGYFYHNGTNDPWQWGAASYVHSGTHAWATTLTGTYPSNADATLYTRVIDLSSFSIYDSTYVKFWYFDSLETDYDYVYLLITEDRGNTWDTLTTYTGYADNWRQEYIDLKPYNGKKVQLAFKFESDYSITKAGFFLDDFEIGVPLDNDVGIRDININPAVTRPNDTVEINILVHNFGLLTQNNFYTVYTVNGPGGTLLSDSSFITSLPSSGDTQVMVYFSPPDTGTYTVTAYTQLSTDEYAANDTFQANFLSGSPDMSLDKYIIGGDGIAEPGENNVPLIVEVINNGARADSVTFALSTTSPNVTITDPSHYIGQVLHGDTATDTFFINVSSSAQNGDVADFTFNILAENNYQSSSNFQIILGGKAWTVMVLINGDNNLTSYGINDVDEMETVGSNDYLNILVQFDGYSSYTDSAGSHQDANRYYIVHNSTPNDMIDAYPIMNLGEVDMGDTNVIFEFFKWGVDNYPARHYLFIIWDHGSGWVKDAAVHKGVSHDDTDDDYLSFANGEVRALLKKMHDYLGRNIDILGYDVCLTQMLENLYEVYGYADHVVASEKSEPGDGWDYHFLETIASNPNITPAELSSEIVSYYSQYYAGQSDVTLSAARLCSNMGKLFGLLNNLSRELIKAGGIGRSDIQTIINNLNGEVETTYEPYKYFVDVKHFAIELKNAGINSAITSICDSIIALYDSSAFFNNSWASSDVSSSMYGVSIMLPPGGESLSGWEAPYSGLLLSSQTLWYRFLTGATALSDTAHSMLNRGYFEVQGNITDTLTENSQGTLHLLISNYTNAADLNVTIIINAPQFITFSSKTVNISVVPEDATIEVELPFTVASQVPNASYNVEITINGATYSDEYRIPFMVVTVPTRVGKNSTNSLPEFRTNTFLKAGSLVPVQFSCPEPGKVSISLFDIQGRKVRTLFEGRLREGAHSVNLKLPHTLTEGIYFVVLKGPAGAKSRRVIIVK